MQILERLRPSQPMDCTGTVVSSTPLTATIKSVRLRLDRPEFKFLPGQSLWPKFERNGQHFSKIYSIASSPHQYPEVELCVSRVGWSSSYLQDLSVGATIPVRGPYGLMTLSEVPNRPRLYLAEGSGIAPIKSHIDWLHHCGFSQPIWLIQANPETPDQLPYKEHWRSLQQSWSTFHYVDAIACSIESILNKQTVDLKGLDIDICAVGDRPSHIEATLLSLGARPYNIRSESFFAF